MAEDPTPTWRPSTKQVASYIRARTKVPGGGIAGDFTKDTKPTGEQVETLIDEALEYVTTGLGEQEPCNDGLKKRAGSVTAMYAAMLVEQSYNPEQTGPGSSFASLERLFTPALKRLEAAVEEQCGVGEGGGGGASTHPKSKGTFPGGPMAGGPRTTW